MKKYQTGFTSTEHSHGICRECADKLLVGIRKVKTYQKKNIRRKIMPKLIFKLTGYLVGTILALLAIAWSSDPASGSLILFFGAVLIIVSSLIKTD